MKYYHTFEIHGIKFYLDCYLVVMNYQIAFFMDNTTNFLFEPCKMFDKKELKRHFRKNNKHWTYSFEDEIIKKIFNSKKIIITTFGL